MTDVEKGIQEIESIDLRDDNALELIEAIINNRFKKLPSYRTDFRENSVMIRCRPLYDNEDFHGKISDYSYNPHPKYIKVGRANYDGQPIFYAARNRGVAMAEVRMMYNNIDKEYFRCSISAWEVTKPLELAALINPLSISKTSDPILKQIANFIEEQNEGFQTHPDVGEFLPLWSYISKKYTEVISTEESYKYKITAAFSNFIYQRLQRCDGILYQSMKNSDQFNIALRKEAIDEGKLRILTAARQKFKRTGNNEWSEEEFTQAKSIDYLSGLITWV